jgi:importin subunit alpha-1
MDNEGESNTQIKAMSEIRKMLSREKDPPINEALHAGVLPVLVRCIEEDMPEEMLMETAWVITNICSGLAVHCQCVVAVGLIPRLICLVSEPTDTVAQQAAWALGNVAGDSAVHRDICLKSGILLPLEQIVSENVDAAADDLTKEKRELMRNVAWVCSNLMRGKDPRPNMKYLAEGARWIGRLVGFVDTEVVRDAVWALSYIADGSDEQIALLTQQPQLVEQVRPHTLGSAHAEVAHWRWFVRNFLGDNLTHRVSVNSGVLLVGVCLCRLWIC